MWHQDTNCRSIWHTVPFELCPIQNYPQNSFNPILIFFKCHHILLQYIVESIVIFLYCVCNVDIRNSHYFYCTFFAYKQGNVWHRISQNRQHGNINFNCHLMYIRYNMLRHITYVAQNIKHTSNNSKSPNYNLNPLFMDFSYYLMHAQAMKGLFLCILFCCSIISKV